MKCLPATWVFFVLVMFFKYVSLQDKPYKFRPESRRIEINQDDTFYIGFDEIKDQTNFGHCHINSSIINVDYPIHPQDYRYRKNGVHINASKGFFPYKTACAFTYSAANNKVPLKWTITAYDNMTNTTFPEEVTVALYYNMPVYLSRMAALQTSTIVNFYYSGTTRLKKCSIRFQNTSVDLDLNAIKVYNYDNIFKSRLYSLGGGKCGYKINNVLAGDPTHLTLIATDIDNKMYRNTSLLVVKKGEKLKNRTQEVYLGDRTTVICGKETDGSADTDQKFCYLYNPKGDLVSHDHMCDYSLDIVTIEDLGTWTCSVGYDFMMDALQFTTKLVEKKPESVATFSKNTTNYYIIGCQLVNFSRYSLKYCKFTRPDSKIFKVTTGGAAANYNTFSSDLDNGKCSLEILKPLRKEDRGTWKCEGAFYGDETTGAFINVEKATTLPYKKNKKKNIRMGNSFVIDCLVPYSSDHCYIIAPNGTQYRPKNRLQITTGLCMFSVDVSHVSDNGTWECSIARKNGIPDDIISIEVSIIDLKLIYSNVEVVEDSAVELTCNTNGIPVDYCRFVSPSGLSYSLRKGNATFNGISYFGHGLEYGDCGIKISKVNLTHSGQWNCHISSGRYDYKNKADLTKKIQLVVKPLLSATTLVGLLGIALAVVTVLAIGGFLLYRYSRRVQCCKTESLQTSHYTDRSSNGSNNSNESAALAISANSMYSTYRRQAYTADE